MTVTPLAGPLAPGAAEPDAPADAASPAPGAFGAELSRALGAASSALERADAAERAFARGEGSLQAMVLERAQADVVLSIATSAAGRTVQSLTALLGMQL